MQCRLILALIVFSLAGCAEPTEPPAGRKVEASGKAATTLADVPAEVLAAARAARPDLAIREAEYETRNGREYYDVGGTLPDGSELELDMTRIEGEWRVVETQRDIGLVDVPAPVVAELPDGWQADRIIESDQGDGVVIYEFFGNDGESETVKIEVRWLDGVAERLRDEWQH